MLLALARLQTPFLTEKPSLEVIAQVPVTFAAT